MSFIYLEITRGVENGKRYLLPDGAISIGRSAQNTIALHSSEKSVSGHHAIIYKSPERILVQDLQSTNGTFVQEEKINEKELAIGDELGFGKNGPRLKLIQSEVELDISSPPPTVSQESTSIRPMENASSQIMNSNEATSQEDQNAISKMKHLSSAASNSPSLNPSMTMQFEQKLVDNNISSAEMQKLMKDGKRLEKILERGELGETQTNMLRTVHRANKSMQRQWYYIVGAILFVSITISSFFGIRTLQYKQLLTKAQSLKSDLEQYEKQIAAANSDPDQNREKLEKLISELEEKQRSFSSLKNQIDVDDFGKFYSDPLEQRIDGILMRFGESDYHIPTEMVERVRHHIEFYSGRLKNTVGRYIKRREKYFPMIQKVFRDKNLPIELAYVSMLESGFNPMALSHAGARGLWQFMPHTGRRYGLKVTDAIDERTDPEKATYAAAEYFKDLIGIFGGKSSVMLCMAAYNAGEGRVMGALRKIEDPMRNRDFWYIYRMGYLAEETNEYIPRVIALMIISENPHDYGFGSSESTPDTGPSESETDFIEVDFKIE